MKEETIVLARYRLEKAGIHLKSAVDLHNCGDYLDAVSRAYYAIFSAAQALLLTKELTSRKHSGIISLFILHFVKPKIVSMECGEILKKARIFREKADYGDYIKISKEQSEQQIENAKKFIQEIGQTLEIEIANSYRRE